jgi:hypothetical protein
LHTPVIPYQARFSRVPPVPIAKEISIRRLPPDENMSIRRQPAAARFGADAWSSPPRPSFFVMAGLDPAIIQLIVMPRRMAGSGPAMTRVLVDAALTFNLVAGWRLAT